MSSSGSAASMAFDSTSYVQNVYDVFLSFRGDKNLKLKMRDRSKVAKVILRVLESVQGPYECVFSEEEETLTITTNVDQHKVVESLAAKSKYGVVQTIGFKRE